MPLEERLKVAHSNPLGVAYVGIDIFIEYIDKALEDQQSPNIRCIFVDFQRNPVGWVLHPDAAQKAGYDPTIYTTGKSRNEWLFAQFRNGRIRPGDKRGTETTSVWVQWKDKHGLGDSVSVEPVGFDSMIVLKAPNLAYPVYLNEEPFKLESSIGRPVVVFDPVDDGVEMYGNVVICRKDFAENNLDRVRTIQRSLQTAWESVKADTPASARQVGTVYKGASDAALENQVKRTVEFVFHGGVQPGTIDVSPDGRLAKTLHALRSSGAVSKNLDFTTLLQYIIPVQ